MDFGDCRGMKVVLVPHCALNQNSRLARCAELPAGDEELIRGLMQRGIGIIQMPCPELMVIALDREHVNIRSALDSRPARAALRTLARELVYQIKEYGACGVKVLGILGKDGSPACGVEQTWRFEPGAGMGVFIEELAAELQEQGQKIEIAGTMDADPQAALEIVDRWDGSAR